MDREMVKPNDSRHATINNNRPATAPDAVQNSLNFVFVTLRCFFTQTLIIKFLVFDRVAAAVATIAVYEKLAT